MEKAEYQGNLDCPQRDSAELKKYAGAQSVDGHVKRAISEEKLAQ